jgi:hypothetical protein
VRFLKQVSLETIALFMPIQAILMDMAFGGTGVSPVHGSPWTFNFSVFQTD